MDYKKVKTDHEAITHRLQDFSREGRNIYESVVALSKRADQISAVMKEELNEKIEEFTSQSDTLEEVFENREQIEIARYYERLPKATLLAKHEYFANKLYIRNPHKDNTEDLPSEGKTEK